jgi:hypothetical protein
MPRTGARAVPIARRATTRPRTCGGKRLVAIGGAIAQNSACDSAVSSRLAKRTSYVGARAESAVDTARTPSVLPRTSRRGSPRVSRASGIDATTTTVAYPVTSRPTSERDRPRSAAMTVSRPIGRTSMVTYEKVLSASMSRAALARRDVMGMTSPVIPVNDSMVVASHP